MSEKYGERRGDQVWVTWTDDWSGEEMSEWRYEPRRMCACGKREQGSCREIKVTTFTETYSCGYVYHYNNSNGYSDNLIEVNGKRVKGK
jgi:hypothetical protein